MYTSIYIFLEPDYYSFNMCENPNLWQDVVLWQTEKCPLLSFIPPLKKPVVFLNITGTLLQQWITFLAIQTFFILSDVLGFALFPIDFWDCACSLFPYAYCVKSVFYSHYLNFITFQYTAVSGFGNSLFQNQQWLLPGYLARVKIFSAT